MSNGLLSPISLTSNVPMGIQSANVLGVMNTTVAEVSTPENETPDVVEPDSEYLLDETPTLDLEPTTHLNVSRFAETTTTSTQMPEGTDSSSTLPNWLGGLALVGNSHVGDIEHVSVQTAGWGTWTLAAFCLWMGVSFLSGWRKAFLDEYKPFRSLEKVNDLVASKPTLAGTLRLFWPGNRSKTTGTLITFLKAEPGETRLTDDLQGAVRSAAGWSATNMPLPNQLRTSQLTDDFCRHLNELHQAFVDDYVGFLDIEKTSTEMTTINDRFFVAATLTKKLMQWYAGVEVLISKNPLYGHLRNLTMPDFEFGFIENVYVPESNRVETRQQWVDLLEKAEASIISTREVFLRTLYTMTGFKP